MTVCYSLPGKHLFRRPINFFINDDNDFLHDECISLCNDVCVLLMLHTHHTSYFRTCCTFRGGDSHQLCSTQNTELCVALIYFPTLIPLYFWLGADRTRLKPKFHYCSRCLFSENEKARQCVWADGRRCRGNRHCRPSTLPFFFPPASLLPDVISFPSFFAFLPVLFCCFGEVW